MVKVQQNCVVHIVSSHPLATDFLCRLLESEPGIEVEDAAKNLPPGVSNEPCIFLIDMTMLKQPPEKVVRTVTARYPAAKFILLENDAESFESDMLFLLFTG